MRVVGHSIHWWQLLSKSDSLRQVGFDYRNYPPQVTAFDEEDADAVGAAQLTPCDVKRLGSYVLCAAKSASQPRVCGTF